MPVYNEGECIASVVRDWLDVLTASVADFRLLVLNDGSTDTTGSRLDAFRGEPRVERVDKPNEGHGPTILRGYRRSVGEADWVFQVDADNEIPASAFPSLWRGREEYDFVFGRRTGRRGPVARRLLSAGSRRLVRLLAGSGVDDVNVPFRLMRSAALAGLLDRIPRGTFAPNVAIAGLAVKLAYRVDNRPVPHRERQTGRGSLVRWRVLRAALQSLVQTTRILTRRCDA
jgi:glycosyltransferase involved in cell wall biosynthesis